MNALFDKIEHYTYETVRDVDDKMNSIGGSYDIPLEVIDKNVEIIHTLHKILTNHLFEFSFNLHTVSELIDKIKDDDRKQQVIDNLYNDTLIADMMMAIRAANKASETFTSVIEG